MTRDPPLRRPQAILFDWDNTLIDSWAAIHDAQNHTMRSFGLPEWTLPETRQRVRGSMRDTYPQMFGERWLEAGEIFYRRFAEKHLDALSPLAGAAELLATLHRDGVYLAVVSNKRGDYLRAEAQKLGWDRYFGRIVGAFDAPRDKPTADPVEMALDGSGLAPGDQVWFVGDADIDLECARNAGCVPILLRPESPRDGEFDAHPPVRHFEGCLSLLLVWRTL